jgi:hypothetical protein
MKNFILLAICVISTNILCAQNYSDSKKKRQSNSSQTSSIGPKIYANLSSGINNPNGFIGIGIDVCFSKNILLGIGTGIGSAGNKLNVKGMYFLKENHLGSALGLSLNATSGFKSSLSNPTNTRSSPIISFDYKYSSGVSANLMYGRYWKVARTGKFFINTGIAVPISKVKVDLLYAGTNVPLSTTTYDDEYTSLNFFTPGGLIFAAGFLIQLNK